MKHRRTPFLLVHSLLFSAAWREGAKAIRPTLQVSTIPEKFVGNTTPGVLFAALEKIVGR
jgi:hypothetical protein